MKNKTTKNKTKISKATKATKPVANRKEKNIQLLPSGKYRVRMNINKEYFTGTFTSMTAAIKFRNATRKANS